MGKVYVKTDGRNRIIGCDGGYSIENIGAELESWLPVDEGEGARYDLCQSNYLEDGLFNENGAYLYKLEGGRAVRRTAAEIAADEPDPVSGKGGQQA